MKMFLCNYVPNPISRKGKILPKKFFVLLYNFGVKGARPRRIKTDSRIIHDAFFTLSFSSAMHDTWAPTLRTICTCNRVVYDLPAMFKIGREASVMVQMTLDATMAKETSAQSLKESHR
jgi:hypothetical protein